MTCCRFGVPVFQRPAICPGTATQRGDAISRLAGSGSTASRRVPQMRAGPRHHGRRAHHAPTRQHRHDASRLRPGRAAPRRGRAHCGSNRIKRPGRADRSCRLLRWCFRAQAQHAPDRKRFHQPLDQCRGFAGPESIRTNGLCLRRLQETPSVATTRTVLVSAMVSLGHRLGIAEGCEWIAAGFRFRPWQRSPLPPTLLSAPFPALRRALAGTMGRISEGFGALQRGSASGRGGWHF